MKSYYLLCLLSLAALASACSFTSKPEQVFERPDETEPTWVYQLDTNIIGEDVVISGADTIVIASTKNMGTRPGEDYADLKSTVFAIRKDGTKLWERDLLVGIDGTYISRMIKTSQGQYLLGGDAQDVENGDLFAWVGLISKSGELLWTKSYRDLDGIVNMLEAANGNFALTAEQNIGYSTTEVSLTLINTIGDLVWSKLYGESFLSTCAVTATKDGGFLLAAATEKEVGVSGKHTRLIRLDAQGDVVWENYYTHSESDNATYMLEDTAGGFFVVGQCEDTLMKEGLSAMKIDKDGKQLWLKTKWWDDDFVTITQVKTTPKGHVAVFGRIGNFRVAYRYFLAEYDLDGNLVWTRSVKNGESGGEPYAFDVFADGTFLVLGTSNTEEREGQTFFGPSLITIPADGGKGSKVNF